MKKAGKGYPKIQKHGIKVWVGDGKEDAATQNNKNSAETHDWKRIVSALTSLCSSSRLL
jgi:hypothetical protein